MKDEIIWMGTEERLERLLKLDGCYNLRHVGGYETLDGKRTRQHSIFRSDSLHRLPLASQTTLLNYGVRTIIDLRHGLEVTKAPNIFSTSPHVTYLNLPLFTEELTEEEIRAGTLQKLYLHLLDSCQSQVKAVMNVIASYPTSILIHCAAGKDRTGLITALLLGLAHVPFTTIATDYSHSADYILPLYASEIEVAKQFGYAHVYESPQQTMLDTLHYLEQQYGGVVGYLGAIGLTNEQINRLRGMLID